MVAHPPESADLDLGVGWTRMPIDQISLARYSPRVSKLVQHVMPRMSPDLREDLADEWQRSTHEIHHASTAKIGAQKTPSSKPCFLLGRCVCKADKQLLRGIRSQFIKACNEHFPPKTDARKAFRCGGVVAHLHNDQCEVWLHVAYVNLSTWHMVVVRLEPETLPDRIVSAAPRLAL